jgi:hypothetical protein
VQTRPQPKQTPHGATIYVIGNIHKNKAEHVQVALREYAMIWYLDLCTFFTPTNLVGSYQSEREEMEQRRPGRERLTIPISQFREFAQMLGGCLELVRELGVEDLHRLCDEAGATLNSMLSGGRDGEIQEGRPASVER